MRPCAVQPYIHTVLRIAIGNILYQEISNIGQRYDVIFEANQTPENYWVRAIPAPGCSKVINANIRAITRHQGVDESVDPIATLFSIVDPECNDETGLVSFLPVNVRPLKYGKQAKISAVQDVKNNFKVKFAINESSLLIDWDNPTRFLRKLRIPVFRVSIM